MPFKSYSINQFLKGCYLSGLPDAIPPGALRRATNVRVDRLLGALTNRPGWSRLTTTALPAAVVWIGKLFGSTVDYSYAIANGVLYRLLDSWINATVIGTPGAPAVSDANFVDGYSGVWKAVVNSRVALKDNGTQTWPLGIAAPGAPPWSATPGADIVTVIDLCDDTTGWTAVAGTIASSATIKISGAASLSFSVPASTLGSITKAIGPLNLDTLVGGDTTVKDDDYIHLWVRLDRPERLEFMQVDFAVDGDAAFNTNFYSAQVFALTRLSRGANQWNKLQIRKNEFTRNGTSASNWSAVTHIRLTFRTTSLGALTVYIDEITVRGGIGLEGNIEYTVTYRNGATGGEGNPPKDAQAVVLYTAPLTVDRQQVNLDLRNVALGGEDYPNDAQITHMHLWRRGGAFATAVLVDEIPIGTQFYTDTFSDSTLALSVHDLETDNDPPPIGRTRVLFGPDAAGHLFMIVDGHRLYFSKPFEAGHSRTENWPPTQAAFIGDGSHRAVGGIAKDTEIYVGTESETFQVLGTDAETFLPVRLPEGHEWLGQYAVTAGAGSVFFVANDGVYEQSGQVQTKLTQAINPFFTEHAVDEQLPMARGITPITIPYDVRADVRLFYYPNPLGDRLVMLYPERGAETCNKFLVLMRNFDDGKFTECFFGDSRLTELRSLAIDAEANELLAGAHNGHIYIVEDNGIELDDTAAMPILLRLGSQDFGRPQGKKKVAAATIEGHTYGGGLDVTAYYGRGETSEPLGRMLTTSLNAVSHHLPTDPERRIDDIAVQISGYVQQQIVINRISYEAEILPEPARFYDTSIVSFPDVQLFKYAEFNIYATAADVVVRLYIEGALKDERPLFTAVPQRVVRHYIRTGLKGYNIRLTLLSDQPFELFSALLWHKPLGRAGWQGRQLEIAQ